MSWHGDKDDEVENDSVGWFNARDYQESAQPAARPSSTERARDDRNDPFAWMRQPGAFRKD
jgi:hypothetical protein